MHQPRRHLSMKTHMAYEQEQSYKTYLSTWVGNLEEAKHPHKPVRKPPKPKNK